MTNTKPKKNIITYKVWTVVWLLNNSKNECKNNGGLVRSNDRLRTKSIGIILDKPFSMTHLFNTKKGISQND